jgi:hypothetical protein
VSWTTLPTSKPGGLRCYVSHRIEWRRLPVPKDPVELQRVVELLHHHAIPTQEGLHRPWRAAGFEPALMVPSHDYLRASALASGLLIENEAQMAWRVRKQREEKKESAI